MHKTDRKEMTEKLEQIRTDLNNYNCCLSEWYCDLYNTLSDYDLLEYVNDIIDVDTAEMIAKDQLDEWWLARLYYFMWDVNWNTAEIVRLDGYWNCEEVHFWDLIDIIDDVLENEWYKDEIDDEWE